MLFIWLLAFVSLSGFEIEAVVDLPLPLSTAEMVSLDPFETVRLILEADPDMDQAFWTFEAHSQDNDDNLILSKSVPTPTGPSLLQMNVEDFTVLNHPGVVVFRTELGNESKPFTYLTNTANKNTTMVLFVKGFTNKYPVPGFHNNSEAKNALHVTWGMNTVSVEFDNAAFLNNSSPIITYSVYQHYLSERNFDKDNYLSKLTTTMLRLDDIIENGNLVDDDFVKSNATPSGGNRVVFSAYPGTAVLFSVVVTTIYPDVNGSDLELSSVYVTSSTYACQLNSNEPLNCQVMWYTITKVVCGISVFVGVFLAFFGHRQYLLSQFFFGAYGTAVCAFMVVAVINDGILVSYTETIGLSIAIGIIGGFLWVLIWYILGIPFLSTALPIAMVGLLFGGIFVYLPPMNIVSMSSDTIYWTTITAFIVGCLLAILPFTKTASIGSCALIGTFIFIIPIDHYIGSSLKFILVNMVRRAYVDSFDLAVLYFPFQTNDIALVCGWIGLAFISFVVQYSREKNRAPFPPNPYQLRRWRLEEGVFLNQNAVNNAEDETLPLLATSDVSDNPRPMSPTSHSPPDYSGYRPVVGYISSTSNRNNSGYGAIIASSPVIRGLESPTLYSSQPRGVAPTSPARRFWPSRQTEPVQQMSTSAEARDLFRPPPGHPSQK